MIEACPNYFEEEHAPGFTREETLRIFSGWVPRSLWMRRGRSMLLSISSDLSKVVALGVGGQLVQEVDQHDGVNVAQIGEGDRVAAAHAISLMAC